MILTQDIYFHQPKLTECIGIYGSCYGVLVDLRETMLIHRGMTMILLYS